ncbi:sulfotransferase family 2 domain-containing protein [Shinella sumterensis]|uniref:sulfotransferase family 2 domain-containing protein n=1 Tax=Shinella sumterensis TaxID=1967501 RepID=UPI003F828EC1
MPRFIAERYGTVVSTSYKVMYSSLVQSPYLREVGESDVRKVLLGRQKYRHIVLARDPYERVRSFYRDKLVKDLNERERRPFQWCQRFILRQMGLWPFASYQRKLTALRSLTFDDFLAILPSVQNNGHLRPQVSLLRSGRHELPPPDMVHQIESDFSTIQEVAPFLTGLGRANATGGLAQNLVISGEALVQFNEIYYHDFNYFGYEFKN